MADAILPTVRLMFACDEPLIDLADSKWVLKHPWSVVRLPAGASFPFRHGELWVYAQLTDGVGVFDVAAEMCQVMDDGSHRWIGRTETTRLDFPGGQQLLAFDMAFRLRKAPFRSAGIYEFRMVAEGEVLPGVTASIRVLDR
jgi:hypothetical protein